MKIKTIKLTLLSLAAPLMCLTVVLSHLHVKDIVASASGHNQHAVDSLTNNELRSKTLADLHHHIDKTTLKNVATDTASTAARTRELQPSADDVTEGTFSEVVHDFMLRFRIVSSLMLQQTLA